MRALILAGGSGTRFWPLSRRLRPKQLLALDGPQSLLQRTVSRVQPLLPADGVWVSTTETLADQVRAQLPDVPAAQVLAEPQGRNTAPAIAWAVRSMPEEQREEAILVLPADHRMTEEEAFREVASRAAAEAEEADRVLALGVKPRWPETGYGYLEVADALSEDGRVRRVTRFTEKPDLATAARFVASGRYLWNAGIFAFRGSTLLALVERLMPDLAAALETIAAAPRRLDELYGRLPATSIDYGIMEKLEEIATVSLDCGWSDLGSWAALAEVLRPTPDGDVRHGDVLSLDSRGNLLWADQGQVAVLGVEGLVVVRTGDTVLVVPLERSQEVRRLVEVMVARDRSDLL